MIFSIPCILFIICNNHDAYYQHKHISNKIWSTERKMEKQKVVVSIKIICNALYIPWSSDFVFLKCVYLFNLIMYYDMYDICRIEIKIDYIRKEQNNRFIGPMQAVKWYYFSLLDIKLLRVRKVLFVGLVLEYFLR